MPFFRCCECGCVEDTALSNFWSARLRQAPRLCSACDPKLAKWHGEFARQSANGWLTDEHGFLWSKREVEDWLGQPIKLIGEEGAPPIANFEAPNSPADERLTVCANDARN
jgi:hypothetical protein